MIRKKVLSQLGEKAILESLDKNTMIVVADKLIKDYDIYASTGFPENIPIPRNTMAKQIIEDINRGNLFVQFVALLIDIHEKGYMGKDFFISNLRELVKEVIDAGYLYDKSKRIFVENPRIRRTRNWGILKEGTEYNFSFLRMDITGNTKLVRTYPRNTIDRVYGNIRSIFNHAIDQRHGRVWQWEGDGGLGAFYLSDNETKATLTAMDILHKIFLYNRMENPIEEPILVRLAVQCGNCEYSKSTEHLHENDTIKSIIMLENTYTKPDSLTVSDKIGMRLDPGILSDFRIFEDPDKKRYYNYALNWKSL